MEQIRTKYTDLCENHLYADFSSPKSLPFSYKSKNKIIYWDSEIAILENINQPKYGQNNKGFRFLISSNYVGETDFRLLHNILNYTWHNSGKGYVSAFSRSLGREFGVPNRVDFHVFILGRCGVKDGLYVDHIDRLKVNNTFTNLRLVSAAENARNKNNMSDIHPCIYRRFGRYHIGLRLNGQQVSFTFKHLDEAMCYFDYFIIKNNLNYGLYIDHSYKSFYSNAFLAKYKGLSKETILKLGEQRTLISTNNSYQNITWSSTFNNWKLQIRYQGKWIVQQSFKTEQEALNFRERFFIDNPQYIKNRTICYSENLELMKGLFYPNATDLNIVYHSDPKFKSGNL